MEDKSINHMEEVSKTASKVMLERGSHVPQLMVYGTRGNTIGVMPDFPSDSEQKRELLMSLGAKMRQADVLGDLEEVFLISEAWMSVLKKGEQPKTSPSQDPARKEVLMIFHQNIRAGKTGGKSFDIIRNDKSQVLELKETQLPSGVTSMESPLLEAFLTGYRYPQFAKDIAVERR